jgi:membrane protease subunit HflC
MNKALAVIVGLLLLVLLVLFSTTYTVRFHQVAVKTTFGREETVQDEPGVHFRFPLFIDRVTKYDRRIQLVETPLVEAPTADGQSVVVKAFLMWRIAPDNVLRFNQSFPKEMSEADRPVRDQLQTAVRSGLGKYAFDQLIGTDSRLPEAEQAILAELGTVSQMGIEPVTVGISQMVLPAKTTKAVLARMEATRSQLAEAERAKGKSEAVGIRSEAKTTVEKFQAFANQRAEEIRGLGEAMAAKFLAEMSENEQLAIFMMDVETLKEALSGFTTIFLTDERAPWHLLNETNEAATGAIPQPRRHAADAPARELEKAEPRDVPGPIATSRREP